MYARKVVAYRCCLYICTCIHEQRVVSALFPRSQISLDHKSFTADTMVFLYGYYYTTRTRYAGFGSHMHTGT